MYYIGIDLGGTNIAAGIVDGNGTIINKGSVPTGRTRASEEIVKDMCLLVKNLINDAGIDQAEIHSIGIGSPGTPDRKNGVIIYNNNLGFRNVPIRKLLQEHFSLPVYLENDANCAAIAECVAGAAKNEPYVVVITIGTGIGGGVIIDNKLYTGFNGAGGELGHGDPNGRRRMHLRQERLLGILFLRYRSDPPDRPGSCRKPAIVDQQHG